jgi:predicted nucleic acid-binding protein
MAFVLDASVAAAWFLTDEMDAASDAALDRLIDGAASVPWLWWFEVRNILVVAEKRSRIDRAGTSQALEMLAALNVIIDTAPDSDMVMRLARQHRLSVYDAAYLELALRDAVPLATSDKSLAAAARAEGVTLLDAAG